MRYTYVRQHDTTDCAAACLAMVCLHYKKEITITRLRDMMGTDMKGTNLVGLQKAAKELAKDFLIFGALAEIIARTTGFHKGLGCSMHAFFIPFGLAVSTA